MSIFLWFLRIGRISGAHQKITCPKEMKLRSVGAGDASCTSLLRDNSLRIWIWVDWFHYTEVFEFMLSTVEKNVLLSKTGAKPSSVQGEKSSQGVCDSIRSVLCCVALRMRSRRLCGLQQSKYTHPQVNIKFTLQRINQVMSYISSERPEPNREFNSEKDTHTHTCLL